MKKQINFMTAKNMYNSGKAIFIVPCNLQPTVEFGSWYKKDQLDFAELLESLMYECDQKRGLRFKFFVECAE